MIKRALGISLVVALAGVAPSANAAPYNFTVLGSLSGGNSTATGINYSGQIVGNFQATISTSHGFIWNGGTMSDLGTLGGTNSYAYAINNAGQVAGNANASGQGSQYATIWNGTAPTNLGTGGGAGGLPYAINNNGLVAGFTLLSDGSNVNATVWNGTTATKLGNLGTPFHSSVGGGSMAFGINDVGQVAGHSVITVDNPNNLYHAVLWNGTTPTDLGTLGGSNSSALAINASGQIVGWSNTSGNFHQHATLWDGATITDLGAGLVGNSRALAINSAGLVVGNSGYGATLWNGTTAINLNSFLDASAISAGWVLGDATGINDNGWIVGNAYNSKLGVSYGYLLAPVPEPETYAMMLAGLGLLGIVVRRRRTAQQLLVI